MKPRVLIISASTGSRHVATGTALAKAFVRDNRVAEVADKEALHYANKLFREIYSKGYVTMIRSAPLLSRSRLLRSYDNSLPTKAVC